MKWLAKASLLAASVLFPTVSALAAPGVTPPNTAFTANGGMTLVRNGPAGSDIWVCNLTLSMNTGTSIGGSPDRASGGQIISGAATGTGCGGLAFNPFGAQNYTITSATSTGGQGTTAINIYLNGSAFCNASSNVPFTWENKASGSTIDFDTAPIYPPSPTQSCYLSGHFATSPNITVVA